MSILHRLFLAISGAVTDDFSPVYRAIVNFRNHLDVYNENLLDYTPHYLYPPAGTLLLSPLSFITNSEYARWVFIGINLVAIIIACIFLVKLLNVSIKSFYLPLLLLFAFFSEAVTNTLVFSNINGVVFLCEVLFFYGTYFNKNILAGIVLGITFTMKPVLLPLLLIPFILHRWKPMIISIILPLIMNMIAIPFSKDPFRYIHKTIPYIKIPRPYSNSSLSGISKHYNLSQPLELGLKFILIVILVVILILTYKYFYHTDQLQWILVTGGVLLCAEFLLSSLGQGYYSILLIPLFTTILLSKSPLQHWAVSLAVYLCFTLDNWHSTEWPALGRSMDYIKFTLGWYLLLYVICLNLLSRFYREHSKQK